MGTPDRPGLFEPSCWNQYDVRLAGLPRYSNLAEPQQFLDNGGYEVLKYISAAM